MGDCFKASIDCHYLEDPHGNAFLLNALRCLACVSVQIVVLNKVDLPEVAAIKEELLARLKEETAHTRYSFAIRQSLHIPKVIQCH